MTDPLLQMYLMACIVVSTAILLFWSTFRKRLKLNTRVFPDDLVNYKRIRRVSRIFWFIFFGFSFMVIIYTALPGMYFIFVPLDTFHHPLINSIGLLVTKLGIAWIVVAQLHIDKELFKHARDIENLPAMELVWYSEVMLLSGMQVLFTGIFLTITNVVGFLLFVTGLVIYFRSRIYRAY